MSLVGMPGNAASEVGANVGEDSYFTFTLTQDEQAIIDCSPLPAIDPGAGKFKPSWSANRIIFQGTKIDKGIVLRFFKRRREKIENGGKTNPNADESSNEPGN